MLNIMEAGGSAASLGGELRTSQKEIKEKEKVKWNSSEFVRLQTGFQNNLYQELIDERLDQLKQDGELSDKDIQSMSQEDRQMKAMDEITAFSDNHAAAYKFLIRTNQEVFDKISGLEKDNPGAPLKKTESEERQKEYARMKEEYKKTEPQRKELSQKILAELRSEKMRLLNKVMEGVKVGKKIEKGGISIDEFVECIAGPFEELFQNNNEKIMEAMNRPEAASEIFKNELQEIINKRLPQEATQRPN